MRTQAIAFAGSGFVGSDVVDHLVGGPKVAQVVIIYHHHDVRIAVAPDFPAGATPLRRASSSDGAPERGRGRTRDGAIIARHLKGGRRLGS